MKRLQFAALLIAVLLITMAVDYVGTPLWVIRDSGSAFGTRCTTCTDSIWRVQAGNGVMLWGDGYSAPQMGLGFVKLQDGRRALEINADGLCLVLNNKSGSSISLCPEDGCLVIRDERQGANHVLDVIGECEKE